MFCSFLNTSNWTYKCCSKGKWQWLIQCTLFLVKLCPLAEYAYDICFRNWLYSYLDVYNVYSQITKVINFENIVLTLIFLHIFWKLYSVSVTNMQRNINVIHSLVFSLEGRAWHEPEPSHVTGMALAHCILGKFLGVVFHCFPLPLDDPILAARCLRPQWRKRS